MYFLFKIFLKFIFQFVHLEQKIEMLNKWSLVVMLLVYMFKHYILHLTKLIR